MSVDFKTLFNVVYHVIENRNPVLLRGKHGVGKSEVVYQIGDTLGLPVVMRRCSQMTEGDLLGLPSINENSTGWNPPDWYKKACSEPVLLFLDEVDRGTLEVRQGVFELTDSRQIAGNKLHEGTIVFAAVNGGPSGQLYSVGDMDPAELDRYTVFDLEPTVKDWIDWADQKVYPGIIEFIRENPTNLEFDGQFEPGTVYPSRRSWKRFSDCCVGAKLFDAFYSCQDADRPAIGASIYNLACAYLGATTAIAFNGFLEEGVKISVEDILEGKLSTEKMKSLSVGIHNAVIDRMEQQKIFDSKIPKKKIQNLCEYLCILPSEIFMRLWTMTYEGANEDNSKEINKTVVDDIPMNLRVAEIILGEEGKEKK